VRDEEFEWDDSKTAWWNHGVSFEMARDVFKDILAWSREWSADS
jgi:uncharacterized DUF497 family protein